MTHSQTIHILSILIVVASGAVSRTVQFNNIILDKYLGDALYAILFYLIFKLLLPKKTITQISLYSLLAVLSIELFQLTGIPLWLRQSDNKLAFYLSIALGTKYSFLDVIAYLIGLISVAFIDSAVHNIINKQTTQK